MKLFLSAKLQKQMGLKLAKTPVPDDPMDYWYAHLISLEDADALIAILPEYRFCAILWDIQIDSSADLSQLLVPAIRKALHSAYYGIPQSVIDRYIPEGTVLEPAVTGDRGAISKMGAVTTKIQEKAHPWFGEDFDLEGTQLTTNNTYFPIGNGDYTEPWRAVREQLQQRYGKAVPAFELEISLDLQQYVARRTLIVLADMPFAFLHERLESLLRWSYRAGQHRFVLPPAGDRDTPLHVLGGSVDEDTLPDGEPYEWDDEVRLIDLLREGDAFQYIREREGADCIWAFHIHVHRYLPAMEGPLPVCTFAEGRIPPEWVDGPADYQLFLQVLQNPEDPRHLLQKAGSSWLQADGAAASPEEITEDLQHRYGYTGF